MAYLNFSFVFIWLKSSFCKIRQLTNLNLVDVHGLDIKVFFTFYSCLVVGLNLHVAKDSIRFTLYKYKGFTVEYFGHHRHLFSHLFSGCQQAPILCWIECISKHILYWLSDISQSCYALTVSKYITWHCSWSSQGNFDSVSPCYSFFRELNTPVKRNIVVAMETKSVL